MAKISGFTADNSPALTDLVGYTKDPGGTPLTRSTTIQGVHDAISDYAQISRNSASPGAQTGVIGTSYVKIDQFDTDGPNLGSTPSHANDQITVGSTGVYNLEFAVSFEGSNTTIYTVAIHVNAVSNDAFRGIRSVGTGTDIGSAARAGVLSLSAGDVVDLRVKSDGAAKDFDMHSGTLAITRIV